jgi:hypothetical protein
MKGKKMKTGKTLQDLAAEIDARSKIKRDFIAESKELAFVAGETEVMADRIQDTTKLEINGHGSFGINPTAHQQFSSKLKIPKKYYDTMLDSAQPLLRNNVNWWLRSNSHKKHMVRCYDDSQLISQPALMPDDGGLKKTCRALLSNRYFALDYDEILERTLPVLSGMPVHIRSCDVTEIKLYLKATFPEIQREIKPATRKVGDVVEAGWMLSTSEVGMGGINAQPFIFTLSCLNGAVINQLAMKRYHIGRVIEGSEAFEYFKDDTRKAEDEAFLLKLRDTIHAVANKDNFKMLTDRMQETTEHKIETRPDKAVEVLAKKASFNDDEHTSVLSHLIEGGDLSQYGMVNAVTRASQDVPDYDRATELERLGGSLIDLKPSEWKEISEAA